MVCTTGGNRTGRSREHDGKKYDITDINSGTKHYCSEVNGDYSKAGVVFLDLFAFSRGASDKEAVLQLVFAKGYQWTPFHGFLSV